MSEKIYLALENGKIFEGKSFGAKGDSIGELVFSTNVVGFVETLTDPCYAGQILCQTFPMIGNYGVNKLDMVSDKCYLKGYVVKDYCETPSNFRMEMTINEFLKEQGVIGIYGVDTREITKIVRDEGNMKAYIVDDLKKLDSLKLLKIDDEISQVNFNGIEKFNANSNKNIALVNFGNYKLLANSLVNRGYNVTCYPFDFKTDEITNGNFDAVVLSEGPSNPAENTTIISEVKSLLNSKKVLGIGLGFEIMALASGMKTYKLKHGHRGGNQPVKDFESGKTIIATQNHGYAVDEKSIANAKLTHKNINDDTVEGIEFANGSMGIQFNPDGSSIPNGCANTIDLFLANIKKN